MYREEIMLWLEHLANRETIPACREALETASWIVYGCPEDVVESYSVVVAKHEEKDKTNGHCNCWSPCLNKEEKPQVDCENCDFRKFSEKFADGFVNFMKKNDTASFEQLSEILKGGAE